MKQIWTPSKQHYTAKRWCINNDIKVFPKPLNGKYYLVYVINGLGKRGRKTYTKEEMENNWWEFYLYLYTKYNDV